MSQYHQFHFPTQFLNVNISINFVELCPIFETPNVRTYIIMVTYISYACVSIIIRTCGVDRVV